MRRSLAVLLWIIAGLLACFLGTLSALVNTEAGRSLLGAVARSAAASAVGGRIEIGSVHGGLLTDLQLSDVRLFDPDSTLVADLPSVGLSYRLPDFLAGRVVLRDVTLDRPYVNLLQHRNGRLDIEELLHLGERHDGPPASGPPALILFRNVHIDDGTVLLRLQERTPTPSDSSAEIEYAGADGRRRVRRFEHVHAVVPTLEISSPTEKGIRIDVDSLSTRINDPAVVVRDLAGRAIIVGDSLTADFRRVGLPGTAATLKGKFRWPHGPVLYDLAVKADSATLSDLAFLVPGLPAGAVYRGAAQVRSHGPDLLEVLLDPLEVRYHGGTLTGHVTALSRAGAGLAALRGGDLTAQDFDLAFAKPFIDSLPFLGRLDGHTTVDGDIDALALSVDWTFRDSLVPGWPVSHIRGSGTVGVGAPLGLRFAPFTVQAADIDLATARRAIPGLPLRGRLAAAGTLTGRIRNVHFAGAFRQQDVGGGAPATVAHGTIGFDTRTDTLGVTADLTADTISFDGLASSFPGLPIHGAVTGTVRASGTPEALVTHLDLTGVMGAGRLKADGTMALARNRWGARDASVSWTDVDLRDWIAGAPPARLTGRATGSVLADSGHAPAGAVQAVIDPSMVAGAAVDGGWLGARFADDHVYVDSLLLHQPGVRVTALGDIGWRHPANGSLIVDIEADSVDGLDSLLTWVTGVARAPDGAAAPLIGDARASVTLDGALDALTVTVRGSFDRLRARGLAFSGALTHFQVAPTGQLTADVTLDSARGFGEQVNGLRAEARGVPDSLTWSLRTALGDLARVDGGGRFHRSPATGMSLGVDSLGLQIPGGAWSLDAPVDVTVADSAIRVGTLSFTQQGGTGKVTGQADLLRSGPGQATLQAVGVPIAGVYSLLERDTAGVGGVLTATLGVAGTRAQPTYTGSFALSGASFGDFRSPYVDGTMSYQDQRLDGTMHVWRSGQRVLNLTAHLPLDLALEPVTHRQLPDTLAVRAVADSVDLSVLEAVTPVLKRVGGYLSADAGIRGTWDAPRLDGTIRIDSAAATIPSIGARYEELAGRFRLSGDTVDVESVTAQSDKGTARVTGYVRLDQLTKPILALHISADRFKALDIRNYLSVTASAELNLNGPVFGATLTGRGTVTSGVLYFADLVNKRVINLDSPDPWIASLIDTSLADLIRRERLGPAFQSVFLDSLRVDGLHLTMGNDVWLRSNEANIQLAGAVDLNKRLKSYLVSGTLQTPRGTYRLTLKPVTRDFTVTQGTVTYFGTPDLDAGLNIRATHVVHTTNASSGGPQDVTVTVNIGGTLLAPKLTLSSDQPNLSQTEIISYLLFGQPTAPIGEQGGLGSRSALLTSTVASLVSGQVEQSVVTDLGIPIDYFEFHPGGQSGDLLSGAQLAAGWQIGRKTFLVLNAGYCQNAPVDLSSTLGASLQFRISPEWRTEASFEPVTNCNQSYVGYLGGLGGASALRQVGLDLFWERHY